MLASVETALDRVLALKGKKKQNKPNIHLKSLNQKNGSNIAIFLGNNLITQLITCPNQHDTDKDEEAPNDSPILSYLGRNSTEPSGA